MTLDEAIQKCEKDASFILEWAKSERATENGECHDAYMRMYEWTCQLGTWLRELRSYRDTKKAYSLEDDLK